MYLELPGEAKTNKTIGDEYLVLLWIQVSAIVGE